MSGAGGLTARRWISEVRVRADQRSGRDTAPWAGSRDRADMAGTEHGQKQSEEGGGGRGTEKNDMGQSGTGWIRLGVGF